MGRTFPFVHDFRRLTVWQSSRELAVTVDALARSFPRSDRGVVGGQLRRAVLSIPSNIAEGCGMGSRKETIRFLHIAARSAKEAENHAIIAGDLRYISTAAREHILNQLTAIQAMLAKLIANLP